MDVDEVRRSTRELLGSSDDEDVAHIDETLLAEYEADARDVAEAEGDEALEPPEEAEGDEALEPPEGAREKAMLIRTYYGNRLAYGAMGVLYFSNGSPNRPNDPCGRQRRWWVRLTPGSRIDPFRRCSTYWGYRITVY